MAVNEAANSGNPDPVLKVEDLTVDFDARGRVVNVLAGLDFELGAGETLGIVGESGSGKSQTALSILGLLPANARVGHGPQ